MYQPTRQHTHRLTTGSRHHFYVRKPISLPWEGTNKTCTQNRSWPKPSVQRLELLTFLVHNSTSALLQWQSTAESSYANSKSHMMSKCHSAAETGKLLAVNINLLSRSHTSLSNLPLKKKTTKCTTGLHEAGRGGGMPTPQGCMKTNALV